MIKFIKKKSTMIKFDLNIVNSHENSFLKLTVEVKLVQ